MSKCEMLIAKYLDAAKESKNLINMDVIELSGYYLHHYKGDPIGGINLDSMRFAVPSTTAEIAKVVIIAALESSEEVGVYEEVL